MQEKRHNSTRRSVTSRQPDSKERPRVEVSAGGLVFKRTSRGLYFAMLKDSFGKWTFPKGHVRRVEDYAQGAQREVREELGLVDLRLRGSLGSIDIWFRDRYVYKGKLIHKFIHYFLFEAPPHAKLRKPVGKMHGERILAVAWVPVGELEARSTYKDMKPIIKKALAHVRMLDENHRV